MADTLNIDGGIVGAAIAADNVIVALYFAYLFYLAAPGSKTSTKTDTNEKLDQLEEEMGVPGEKTQRITASTIAYSISTASCLVTVGSMLTKAVCPSISSLVLTSLLTVVSATILPSWFLKLRSSGLAIGILFLQLFFAASAATLDRPDRKMQLAISWGMSEILALMLTVLLHVFIRQQRVRVFILIVVMLLAFYV